MPRCASTLGIAVVLAVWPLFAAGNPTADFEASFHDETLRIDIYHTGDASSETIALDRVIRSGIWSGSRVHLVDAPDRGAYRASVVDDDSVLFRHGFDSLFREYATTAPAHRGAVRTFHESVLVPCPREPFRFVVERRSRDNSFTEVFATTIDPDAVSVVREIPQAGVEVPARIRHGDPHRSVDLAVLGEGYTADEKGLFLRDFHRFAKVIMSYEPFAELMTRFNLYGVFVPSPDSGCDEPTHGVWRRTPFDTSFNAFGSPRYLLTENNRAVRDAAGHVPYDLVLIMVNHDRYGGGGIYNLYTTFTAHNPWSEYVCVHELGHAFAGLADEYFTSSVAYSELYPRGVEPVEPNITALLDPGTVKWGDLVDPSTPVPTPWLKDEFETIETAYQQKRRELNTAIAEARRAGAPDDEIETLEQKALQLSQRHARRVDQLLRAVELRDEVGAFQGAGYSSEGLYRPMVDCIMFSKGDKPFCAVCQRAIRRTIELYGEGGTADRDRPAHDPPGGPR